MASASALTFLDGIPVTAGNAPEANWNRPFGGSDYDYAESVQQTSDGGYIVAGYTNSYGEGLSDVWLIRINSLGNPIWDKTFGGSSNDHGYFVQQTSDGGYIVAGDTQSFGDGGSDVWLIKTDADGKEEWNQTFGGSDGDYGYSVQQTSDDGYIILGETESFGAGNSDVWLIKTDSSGEKIWDKTFGGSDNDHGYSVQQTTDDGYIIAGETESKGAGNYDVWLIKTDSSGEKVWDKTFGGSSYDHGYFVQQSSEGGYILTGYTESYGVGLSDVWLIKTDADGKEEWNQTFGSSSYEMGACVQQTSDDGYILTGYTESYGAGSWDMWLIKTDSVGEKVWDKTFGGSGYDYGSSVQQTSDDGYIITGSTSSYGFGQFDVWLVKVEPEAPVIPSLYSVSPGSGNQEETLDVTITGANLKGAVAVDFGAGITINSFNADNDTQITAEITIDSDAMLGTRAISVVTPDGSDTLTDSFKVTSPSFPAITEVNPGFGDQGEKLDVIITGANLTGATNVSFGAGITVSFTVDNDTQVTASITISSNAATGTRDVSVNTPDGSDILAGGFTVTAPSAPWTTAISPDSGYQGETLNVTITGASFTRATSVSFGTGITVIRFSSDNDTQITADIFIDSDAETGTRDVTVINPGGSGTLVSGFTITDNLSPEITGINPGSGKQGETLNIIITGTNLSGVSDVIFGEGITVNSFNADSGTQITASISIDSKASLEERDVSVTTPRGADTMEDSFMINESNSGSDNDNDGASSLKTNQSDSDSSFDMYFKLTSSWILFIAASEAVVILACLVYFVANKKLR